MLSLTPTKSPIINSSLTICSRCDYPFTKELNLTNNTNYTKCNNCIKLATIYATKRLARRNAKWNETLQNSIWAPLDARLNIEKAIFEEQNARVAALNKTQIDTEIIARSNICHISNCIQPTKTHLQKTKLKVKTEKKTSLKNPICNIGSMIEFPNLSSLHSRLAKGK